MIDLDIELPPNAHNVYSDRVCTPEETFARVRPFLSRFGVTRIARHTGLDKVGIPVWCAYTPNSRSIVVAQGKGLTDADARISAVMEALERAVAGEPAVETVIDTADNLRASGWAVDPLDALIAAGQGNIRPDETIEWVRGTDLISGGDVFVPLEAALLDRTIAFCSQAESPDVAQMRQKETDRAEARTHVSASRSGAFCSQAESPDVAQMRQKEIDSAEARTHVSASRFGAFCSQAESPDVAQMRQCSKASRFWMSSDGLASGNNQQEAILHGLLERIERDAHILWRVSGPEARHGQCVAPETLGDPALDALVGRIEAATLDLRLFDITSDTQIPCFLALLGPRNTASRAGLRYVEVTSGCGAHPCAVRAAIRAVTEAAQSRLTYISGARDDVYAETFSRPLPESTRHAFLATPRAAAAFSPLAGGSVEALLRHVIDRVKHAGVQSAIAVPLCRDDLPISVVKMFVPALEHPDGERARRFGPRALSKAISS